MPPFIRYLIQRLLSVPITLFVITAVLYGVVMLTPADVRATLYMPKRLPNRVTEEQVAKMIELRIKRYRLNDPYPVQYLMWAGNLVRGDWGYSPVLQEGVLEALLRRTPATVELTLYSILAFLPLGLLSGIVSSRYRNRPIDHQFRLVAFIATSLPSFILALFLLAIFYISLGWFAPERLSLSLHYQLQSTDFRAYTGLMTLDGLLNGRPDVTIDAFRHLAMPVFTLALAHLATLGRVTRTTMIEELQKDYIISGRARGINERRLVWRHALRNAFAPALTSSILSAAALVTGVFVVEIIYNFHGVSTIALAGMQGVPDAPATLGFAIYSVIVVLLLMLGLDILQAIVDPRIQKGVAER